MKSNPKPKHTHKEAFCLMWYACSFCGHRERVWNSRDGVTPFITSCPSCAGCLQHTDFHLDEYAPDHKPYRGQLVWRDGTVEDAKAIIERRYYAMREHYPEQASLERLAERLREIETGTDSGFPPGWPISERHVP